MTRRSLLAAIAGGLAAQLAPGELWEPGKKLISIPKSVRPPRWEDLAFVAVSGGRGVSFEQLKDYAIWGVLNYAERRGVEAMRNPVYAAPGVVVESMYRDVRMNQDLVRVSCRVKL